MLFLQKPSLIVDVVSSCVDIVDVVVSSCVDIVDVVVSSCVDIVDVVVSSCVDIVDMAVSSCVDIVADVVVSLCVVIVIDAVVVSSGVDIKGDMSYCVEPIDISLLVDDVKIVGVDSISKDVILFIDVVSCGVVNRPP